MTPIILSSTYLFSSFFLIADGEHQTTPYVQSLSTEAEEMEMEREWQRSKSHWSKIALE